MIMRHFIIAVASAAAGLLLAGAPLSADDIRKVRDIEFRGLTLLSKYDIIRGTRLKAVSDGIIIDVSSLEGAMSGNPFIASYGVRESGGRLVVTVAERKPEVIVAAAGEKGIEIYELDAGGRIISRNDPHTAAVPVIHAGRGEFPSPGGAGGIEALMDLLSLVKERDGATYGEITELYPEGERLRLFARGRRTEFVLRPLEGDFASLRQLLGICDHSVRKPEKITLSDNAAIVR